MTDFRRPVPVSEPFSHPASMTGTEAALIAHTAPGLAEMVLCAAGIADCRDIGSALIRIGQIIAADIVLSGDSALVIAMAASGLPPGQRRIAICSGLALAAGLRMVFAVVAASLIRIPGILFLGGLLLAWVCLRFCRDLRHFNSAPPENGDAPAPAAAAAGPRPLLRALVTITLADVSMSLDNVIAVAAIAREDTVMLIAGLALAIGLMAFCATLIMKILTRFPFLSWAGLAFLIYLTLTLLYDGALDLAALSGLM